jgi:D-inositol-3-phosphate glycosyltransferase
MKILEVEVFGRGGLAHYVNNLSRALAARGHEVTLITAANYELDGQGDLPASLRIIKRTARSREQFNNAHRSVRLRTLRRLQAIGDALVVTRLAQRLRPEVIHLHSTNPIALLYLTLFRLLGPRVVYTAHVVTPHERTRFDSLISGSINRLADRIITHSRFDSVRLQTEFSVNPERISVIPHGEYGFFERHGAPPDRSGARRILGLAPEDEVALFFGYIREYKGLDLLLEAWPAVSAARPHARLVIAGDPVQLGQDRLAELEEWAERLHAIHRFDYIPFAEVTQYFAAADVLVMPYRRISQSGVLFLSLALGVPVIATAVGGLPEMLEDGETALLISAESTPLLTEALIRVFADPDLRDRLAEGGRRLSALYSWDSIAEQTELAFAASNQIKD